MSVKFIENQEHPLSRQGPPATQIPRDLASSRSLRQHRADPACEADRASHGMQKNFLKSQAAIDPDRRPMNTRSSPWAQDLARGLSRLGISANQVSLVSVGVAILGATLLLWSTTGDRGAWPFLLAAACLQLRLLANMLDGLIAVEGGDKTLTGELYNEIPDRIADVVLLAAAGYASQHGPCGAALGWSAAALAVGTAYLRALGGAAGSATRFLRPARQAATHVPAYLRMLVCRRRAL
jgi:phosphatidylglycerophosphate synthase